MYINSIFFSWPSLECYLVFCIKISKNTKKNFHLGIFSVSLQNELFSFNTSFQWNIISWYNCVLAGDHWVGNDTFKHSNIQISKYLNIQISEYLVGASVLARDDSWVRNDKPTTGLQPTAVRIDKSTREMPGPVSTGAMVRTLPGAFLPCVDIGGSFNVIKRTILALHRAVDALLSLFSWVREGRGSQEAEQQYRNHVEEDAKNILVSRSVNRQREREFVSFME